MCVCVCVPLSLYLYINIRRAFGPRRSEITDINPLSFNPLRGLPPPIILPLGGPGAKSCCAVE